ncbi:GNAT family N-acetyltransferase [Tessaracoccus caeni]|uniref:GNAT family N-acetyltransferase n=1 Tax=Tessaracoccus caeni TaxID=3031239 RepID=UPI0023DCDA7A|nr:GNAT family N-acetyltransferase [Tessaracoccus caeni]MDF1486734.1 GNAT family N-acetyltransferase [Tessaracoccus caeni]
MTVVVRPAEASDLEVLRTHQSRPELNLVDRHFALQQEGKLIIAVAFDADGPLGSAIIEWEGEDLSPELRNMYVFPEARRKGAGKALTQWIEDQARARGFSAVYLAVDPNNEKAVPLYVSLEYHPTGEHIFVEVPEIIQTEGEAPKPTHYAVYKKSLTAH